MELCQNSHRQESVRDGISEISEVLVATYRDGMVLRGVLCMVCGRLALPGVSHVQFDGHEMLRYSLVQAVF